MLARKRGCERCLQADMLWVTPGRGPGGPQGSHLSAIMVSLLHLFLKNSVLPLSLCSSLPQCCSQAVCVAQRSPAAGAGGAVLPWAGRCCRPRPPKRIPLVENPPFRMDSGEWDSIPSPRGFWAKNLHNLPIMPHHSQAQSKSGDGAGLNGAGSGDPHWDMVPPRCSWCWCTPGHGEQSSR